ncbi:hypothetical protein BH23GEM8_BH23GEM8_23590 [soil metagenome]
MGPRPPITISTMNARGIERWSTVLPKFQMQMLLEAVPGLRRSLVFLPSEEEPPTGPVHRPAPI